MQNTNLDKNVIDTELRVKQQILKAGAILALAFFGGTLCKVAWANDIIASLSGRTAFEAGKTYRPWRQYFSADGSTVYFGDGPSSLGEWEVRGNKYCSLWPPAKNWACYEVELTPAVAPYQSIIWIAEDGSRTGADLFDGDQSQLRAAPKR